MDDIAAGVLNVTMGCEMSDISVQIVGIHSYDNDDRSKKYFNGAMLTEIIIITIINIKVPAAAGHSARNWCRAHVYCLII